jgi:hypothetical protein
VIAQWPGAGAVSFIFRIDSTGKLSFAYDVTGGGGANATASTLTITYNTWCHVAWVRSGTTFKYFINGVQDATTNTVSGSFINSSGPVLVGLYNTGVDTYFNGYISNLRFTKGIALYTTAFTPSTSPLTTTSQGATASNVSLLTCQNNTFIDNSTNYFVITSIGDSKPLPVSPFTPTTSLTATDYSARTFGGSMYFDGSGDYLAFSSLGLYSIDFTIEGWIYLTALGSNQTIFTTYNLNSVQVGTMIFLVNSANKLAAQNNTTSITPTSAAMVANSWYHVAMTYKLSTTTITVYVNGVNGGSVSAPITNSSSTNWFGLSPGDNNIGSWIFNGYMSDMRITKGVALYTANFFPGATPATPTYTIGTTTYSSNLLLSGATGGVIDYSRTVDLETVGDARTAQFSPYNGTYYSNYFDGSGDLLTFTATSTFAFGTGNFTVECWVYPMAYGGSVVGAQLFGTTNGSATGYSINLGQDINSFRIISNASGGWADNLTVAAGGGPSLGVWTHIAVVRSGANLTIYKNGVSVATTASAAAWSFSGTNGVVGRFNDGTYTRDLTGYISNLRVVNSALYSTTFTPSTTPLTTVSGTQLLTCQSRTFIDNSTNALVITRTGDVAVRSQNPFQVNTGVSYYFDGTGDAAIMPYNNQLHLLQGDFTIECWFYSASSAANQAIISQWLQSVGNGGYAFGVGSSALFFSFGAISEGAAAITGSSNYVLNQWNHGAIVRSGSTFTLYQNGVSVGTTTSTATKTPLAVNTVMGNYYASGGTLPATGANYFNGYITDLRISKGYARYTATFTPPTAPIETK